MAFMEPPGSAPAPRCGAGRAKRRLRRTAVGLVVCFQIGLKRCPLNRHFLHRPDAVGTLSEHYRPFGWGAPAVQADVEQRGMALLTILFLRVILRPLQRPKDPSAVGAARMHGCISATV